MKKLSTLLLMSYMPFAVVAGDVTEHPAAKMLTPSKAEQKLATKSVVKERKQIANSFGRAYDNAGRPAIAIFWNRKFDDQLSQWYQTLRTSQTGESSSQVEDKFEPKSGSEEEAYQRNISGGGKIVSSQYIEKREKEQQREGLAEADQFEFAAGYTSTFLDVPAKILDRKAIMRIIQRDNARQAGAEMISDYQKIEADALIGYADYLAEVVLTKDASAATGFAFMVSVKSVSDGQVVAMFKSKGNSPLASTSKWQASAGGYKQKSGGLGTPNEVGEQLAFETMTALSKAWK